MPRPAFGLLFSAALIAGGASAQSTSAPGPAAAAPGKVVEGVTVTGRRLPSKGCSSRDEACIATVVAELKARYPQELRKRCDQVEERTAMNSLQFMDINLDRPHPNVGPYLPPAVTKTACAADRKP
jgi:hypothetical protein